MLKRNSQAFFAPFWKEVAPFGKRRKKLNFTPVPAAFFGFYHSAGRRCLKKAARRRQAARGAEQGEGNAWFWRCPPTFCMDFFEKMSPCGAPCGALGAKKGGQCVDLALPSCLLYGFFP